jgi:hypothetical protein
MDTPAGVKLQFVRRLDRGWKDLAEYFDIQSYERNRWERGDEPRELWQYLENRQKLYALVEALTFIGRDDLAEMLANTLDPLA